MPGVLPRGSFLCGIAPVKEKFVLGFVGTERDFSEEQLLRAYGINFEDGINCCELVLTVWAFVND